MRKILMLLTLLVLFASQLSAQSRTVTGKVTDAAGNPVPNATVAVKGTSVGTTTKADGSYSITVPAGAKALVISSIDMNPEEITLGTKNSIDVSLKSGDRSLQEVVITGYTREKKGQFTGAAAVLSGKVVETVPVGSFDQALQGRAPGMLVNSSSGQPGTSPTITIRGVQSIQGAGAQPLFVIDGIPMPAADFATINPNDFESITVLKDASAAALYGARGGVGVIVITTKKGKTGATNFTYRTQVGMTQKANTTNFDLMNSAEMLQYEEKMQIATTPGWEYSRTNPNKLVGSTRVPKTDADFAFGDHMLDSMRKINTNFSDLLFRQGFSQLHELNMSGGSDKTKFFLSGAYFDQEGTDLSSRLRRYTTRFNIEHTSNKLTVTFNTLAGYSITNYSEGEWLGNSARNSFQMSWRAKPYENPYRADGSIIFGTSTALAPKQIGVVLEGIENSLLKQNQIKINTGLTLAYKLLPYLTFRNTFGIDVTDDRWQRWIRPNSFVGSGQTYTAGINSESYKLSSQLINNTGLLFNKKFDVHEIEGGAYFEVVRGYQKGLGFTMYNLDPRLPETGQGAGPLPIAYPASATAGTINFNQLGSSAKGGFGIRSYFATAKYTYDNKYTVTANVRRDGTSRIANEANKEVTTYSVGASWNAMEENFMRNQDFISDLRVRASYGAVPNIGSIATSSYGVTGGLVSVTNYLGPQIPSFSTTSYPGSSLTGLVPSSPGNSTLKIETIRKLNIGTDFALWNDRARFTIDVYKNKTVDLFVRQPLPAESGFGNLDINAGVMTNKGIELTVAVDAIKTKNVGLTLGFNHSINKNNIESLGLVDEYVLGTFVIRKGLPYGSHYTYHYLGADAATGKPRYEKLDGTETNDIGQAGQFAKFGTYLPKHVGGFNADLRVGAFTVSALFSYQFDVVRSNNIENWITRGTTGYQGTLNGSKRLLTQQWTKPGDNAFYQGIAYDRQFTSSDLQNAKFLRFRNLNVAYQIPAQMINGVKIIKSARLYVQAQNIWVWSPWKGPDPEDGNNISLNEFPNPRMVVAGIDINF